MTGSQTREVCGLDKLSERILPLLRKSPMSFNQLKRVLGVHQQTLANMIRHMKEEIRSTPVVDVGRKRTQIVYDLKEPPQARVLRSPRETVDSKLSTARVTESSERVLAVWPGLGTVTEWFDGSYLHVEGYRGNRIAPGSLSLMRPRSPDGS